MSSLKERMEVQKGAGQSLGKGREEEIVQELSERQDHQPILSFH